MTRAQSDRAKGRIAKTAERLAAAASRVRSSQADLARLESRWASPSRVSDPLRPEALAAIASLETALADGMAAFASGDDARFAEANAAVLAGAERVEAVSAKLRARRARSAR